MAENIENSLVATGRDGSGAGIVLDQHSDFNAQGVYGQQIQLTLMDQQRKAAEQARKDLAAQQKAKQDAANWKPVMEMLTKNQFGPRFQAEQVKDLERQVSVLGTYKAANQDPNDINSEAGRYRIQFENENQLKAGMAKQIAQREEDLLKHVGDPKYNQDVLRAYIEKWHDIPDDDGGIKKAYDYMTDANNNPLQVNIDMDDLYKSLTPDYQQMGRVKQVNQQDIADMAAIRFNTPQGTEEMETLIAQGFGKTPDEVIDNITAEVVRRNPKQVGIYPDSSDDSKKGVEVIAAPDPAFPGAEDGDNTFQIRGLKEPIAFVGEDGQTYHSKDIFGHVSEDGSGWVVDVQVKAPEPGKAPEVQYKNPEEPDAKKRVFTDEYTKESAEYRAKKAAYESGRVTTKKLWVSNKPGSAGYANYKAISDRLETPLDQYLKSSESGSNKPSTLFKDVPVGGF